jgi:hypothetical protein
MKLRGWGKERTVVKQVRVREMDEAIKIQRTKRKEVR